MFRVATYAQFQQNMSYITRTQSNVAQTQIQIASGKTAQQYSEISRRSSELVGLERAVTLKTQYNDNIGQAIARLDSMETAMNTLVERTTDMIGIASQGLSANFINDLPLEEFAASFSEEIASVLNTRLSGRYLFAGSQTDVPPVDLTDPAYTPQAGLPGAFTADFDYYQGDGVVLSVRVDETFETSYGVTGDNATFEELLRAVSYMDYAGANGDKVVLEESYRMLQSALDGLSDLRGKIGATSDVLDKAREGHTDFIAYSNNLISNIEDVDIAAATTELAGQEVQLQGSYLALTRVQNLSLLDYIR